MNAPSPESVRPAPRLAPGLIGGLLLLALACGTFVRTWREAGGPERAAALAAGSAEDVLSGKLDAFLDAEATPLLRATKEKDLAAAKRALAALDSCFAGYATGIDGFTSDLTGWGTRFKLIWRKGVETAERKDVHSWSAALVKEKFDRHVVSDTRLEADIIEVLRQFSYDLEASRNELLGDLRTRLEASELPVEVRAAALGNVKAKLNTATQELLAALPGRTVAVGVGGLTAGIVAEEAVRQLVRVVIAQAATRLAGGALAGGGAAATAVTAGGAGGTAVAPGVGTAVGIVGGFLVGAAVDWWMSERFEADVKTQCLAFLKDTRAAVVTGEHGLENLLLTQVTVTSDAWERAVAESLRAGIR